jgi:hypothetical protein
VPPAPSEMWPDIPPGLENLLLAMLAKDPDSRPTMLTVAHTLELVRSELVNRRVTPAEPVKRATTALPELRKSARMKSAPGLAPTEEALPSGEWAQPKRRWHVVVGAFALAASAAMFLLSRDTETAAAAEASKPTTADVSAVNSPAVEQAKADVPDVVAPAPVVETVETVDQPKRPVQVKRAVHKLSTKKLSAKPRRDASHDPNGTVDPYL